jgi:HPt (histidine-containing phosphotransfer) domain-containing protein
MPPSGLSLLLFLPDPVVADAIESLLEPFGNRVHRADDLAEAQEQANRQNFDAIITGAGEADMLAAAPGAKTSLVAILLRGHRAPHSTTNVLRWPLEADLLYGILDQICQAKDQDTTQAAIDPAAFSTLEKSVGVKTLVEILQCYIATAEQLTSALAEACSQEKWEEAARLAQDIVGAAGGLGLTAITEAAREFARKARAGENRHELCNAAQAIVGEHMRARQALVHLYPEAA